MWYSYPTIISGVAASQSTCHAIPKMIPIFVIVLACVGVAETLTDLLKFCLDLFNTGNPGNPECSCLLQIVCDLYKLFMLAWSIVGGVYVFPAWNSLNCSDEISTECCNYGIMKSSVYILALLYFKSCIFILSRCYHCCC